MKPVVDAWKRFADDALLVGTDCTVAAQKNHGSLSDCMQVVQRDVEPAARATLIHLQCLDVSAVLYLLCRSEELPIGPLRAVGDDKSLVGVFRLAPQDEPEFAPSRGYFFCSPYLRIPLRLLRPGGLVI